MFSYTLRNNTIIQETHYTAFLSCISVHLFTPEEQLITLGSEAREMYLLQRGDCVVEVAAHHSLDRVRTLRSNDYFGVGLSLIRKSRYFSTAPALLESEHLTTVCSVFLRKKISCK